MNNERNSNGFVMMLSDGRYIYAGHRASFAPGGTTLYTDKVADAKSATFFVNAEMNSEVIDFVRKEHPTAFMVGARQIVTVELVGPINVGKGV